MAETTYRFVVRREQIPQDQHEGRFRLDRFVLAQPEIAISRSQVQRLIAEQAITVNGQPVKAGYGVRTADVVEVHVPAPRPSTLIAENIPIAILYEDDEVLVLNKPAGMVVHPAPGHDKGTLVHALLHHCQQLSGIGGVQRPGIIHRLDRDTSGVMLVAKTDDAHTRLSEQLSRREVTRIYVAVVHGRFNALSGMIDAPIGRHRTDRKKMAVTAYHGRDAQTVYQVIEQFPKHALLRIQLKTGRTHQIRVHMQHIHHPVIGDPVYGISSKNNLDMVRQALHAQCILFTHPATGEQMSFETPLPDDITQMIERLRRHD